MSGDDDSVGGKIKAVISFMMSRVTQEDAEGRPGGQLVGSSSKQVRITLTPENAEMVIGRRSAKEGGMRRARRERFGG